MTRRLNSFELHFKDKNDHDNAVIIDKEPDTCPLCNHGIEALLIDAYGKSDLNKGHFIQSIYKCPRIDCQTVFIAYYTSGSWYGPRNISEYVFLQNTFIPAYIKEENFEKEIERLSPQFVEIYTQASIAENMGLKAICGAGYRKALEYLIKDYLKLTMPTITKEVENHYLGYVIANYVGNERIKKMAGLAKNVGNDETHYIRKIDKLSLEDLKKLIRLTTHWITDELLTEEYATIYEKLMTNDKDKK
ncbi:hypothetical protein COV53_00600 [Candidatus Gottesmanbacteria bacterium CG11_big_fil_rev_8_21_14_0_20_37_11]|uniref:DUF4145 domain-containing protein n=3 Tax=Candidatus Gottesmaniibacteriota TaxID=1752720 RepID=A0A2M7RQD0_9BACT|nr:MAG: hypothetical protein AUJ73_01165 [Candidatus Gottesmanbacteria bacterium CG1_02_37_22]PIP32987.1 MAG: hypothetical protein COX23_01850 [Candidatus Gottesmanbacteria bacterium CG23_combo_of_CG06-09_8_20_14_all_37_19]PIR08898.1 MAG: hypothetical protein COV53_00600 [Candidatus Gottesmanbacteria bacterium CG11_big_fil_rev_8_21_14_0_20_37_11]PIZ02380.1 MAG: hypothetical protein COY59_05185 [Candidatus Gottesmanbacteria bacterium CG_4_10_14_0_8_um_filter_37_24]